MPKIKWPDPHFVAALRCYLEEFVASTYPTNILKRRLGLLTTREAGRVRRLKKEVENLVGEIEAKLDEVDEIVGTRAEKEKDPWR